MSTEHTECDGVSPKGSWKIRRKIIFGTLFFCAFCVTWVLFKGADTETERVIVSSSFALAGGVIGSYIFGAVWDDKHR